MVDTPFITQLMSININMEDYYKGKFEIDERHDIFLTDKEIVKRYPDTLIVFGSTDPIRDECYKLADFLLYFKSFYYNLFNIVKNTIIINFSFFSNLSLF